MAVEHPDVLLDNAPDFTQHTRLVALELTGNSDIRQTCINNYITLMPVQDLVYGLYMYPDLPVMPASH